MVSVNSKNDKIKVNVSSANNKSNANAQYPQTYFDSMSKQWAISDELVNGEDYSSKHYAQEAKKNKESADNILTFVQEEHEAINKDVATGRENIANDLETSLANISAKEKSAVNTVNSAQANAEASIAEKRTNAENSIKQQEETSIGNITSTTATQINKIQTEGAKQIDLAKEQADICTSKTNEVKEISATTLSNLKEVQENVTKSANSASLSEKNAKESENKASTSASSATALASQALASVETASANAVIATNKAKEASTSASSASTSSISANNYAQQAKTSAESANASATKASTSEANALTYKNSALDSKEKASESEKLALNYKNSASSSAETASTKADIATTQANNASKSATNAQTSANNAKDSANSASTSAENAKASQTACEDILNRLGSAIKIKGRVNSLEDLPAIGNLDGDAYLVGAEGLDAYPEYYWYLNHWEFLGTSNNGGTWGTIKGDISEQNDLQSALNAKQNKLTFDTTPTANSTKPVTSGGIKTALDKKIDTTRETKYMPLLYTKQSISNPTNMVAQPYIKLATVTFKNTANYDLSQLFWLEYQQASTFKAHALVKLTARWGATGYVGQVFEILEDYNGGNANWEGILKSLTWAYKFTAKTSTAGNTLTGEIWIKIPNITYCNYYLRPTECNTFNDYGITTVTVTNNPWVYIYSNNQNVASITEGYTQVKVVDKSTYTLKANKTDLPTKTSQLINDSNYATKTEAKYTAGTGISISNNVISNTQTSAEWGNITGDVENQTDLTEYIKSKSGGGGLLPGFLYKVTGWIDESENIFRYPNGQVIAEDDSIKGLTTFLDKQEKLGNTSIFCTETEWQAIKSASKFGQCGKYVRDKDAGTIRLPLIINEQGLNDLASCGVIKSESLPNITGSTATNSVACEWNYTDDMASFFSGSLYVVGKNNSGIVNTGTKATKYILGFNANKSSSTYQDNAPVQQEAIQYPYVLCINSGVEEAERPINNYQVNNVYSYGVSQYYKGEMDNLSWLKSEGQENSGTVYKGVYEWALAKLNSGASDFKASTATDITDYDWVINTANRTFRLPIKNHTEKDIDWSSGVQYTTYGETNIAPYDGFVKFDSLIIAEESGVTGADIELVGEINGQRVYSCKADSSNNYSSYNFMTQDRTTQIAPIKTGQSFRLYTGYETGKTQVYTWSVTLYKAKNDGNLYYYVGDTLQNPDLINLARQQEQIVGKVSKSGDTMTGQLKIKCTPIKDGTTPIVLYQQKASDFGNTTYSNITFKNFADETVGLIGGVEHPDGSHRIRILRKDGSNWVEMPQIVYSYRKGKSGYNLYSNDYCEQWGYAGGLGVVTLLQRYANADYSIIGIKNRGQATSYPLSILNVTATSFQLMSNGDNSPCYWVARGYVM